MNILLGHAVIGKSCQNNQAQLVNFPPEFAAIPCKPLFYDLALYHVAMPR